MVFCLSPSLSVYFRLSNFRELNLREWIWHQFVVCAYIRCVCMVASTAHMQLSCHINQLGTAVARQLTKLYEPKA